jgi:tetratricopeptide (TPR) repeat protein
MSARPVHARLRPRTYAVAIYVVAGVIVLQLILVVSIFWFRDKVVRNIDLSAPSVSSPAPLAVVPSGRPTPASSNPGSRLDPQKLSNPKGRIDELNQEALSFQQKKEYRMAEAALAEAEKLDPRNVLTLTNLAALAEERGDTPKARQFWTRVLALGVTPSFKMAEQHLATLANPDSRDAVHRASLPHRLVMGAIVQNNATPEPGATEFTLRIPIMASPKENSIDAGAVGIKLYCYDRTQDGKIVPTVGQVTAQFEGDRQTWNRNRTETLVASYYLPAGESTRRFHGYIVRIFYQGELQDEIASPRELLQLVVSR